MELSTSQPRVIGWLRGAAILDGDWGTSLAYVLGIAFALAGYASGLHLVMMVAFTIMIALNYVSICKLYPNGGGVYSSVSHRSKSFAVIGALMLAADYVVTVSLSVLDGCHYLGFHNPQYWAIGIIAIIGAMNWFGPRHAGSFAVIISGATLLCLAILVSFSFPTAVQNINFTPAEGGILDNWRIFVGIILSISGIEAISNMTGVMKDPLNNSRRAILSVLAKISIATLVLTFAMNAIPALDRLEYKEEMVRHLGVVYVGDWFGPIIGFVIALLLISAGNTAINALTAIQFLMAVDGELPKPLRRLNKHGVPVLPLVSATLIPIIVLLIVHDVITLAQMYAIGVVGAVLINIGSTGTDPDIKLSTVKRWFMIGSAIILFFIEATIAIEKTKALIFALTVLAVGLSARWLARRTSASVVAQQQPPVSQPAVLSGNLNGGVMFESRMMVAIKNRGEHLLRQACHEAKLRNSFLFILSIKEISIVGFLPQKIQTDAFPTFEWIKEICDEYGVPFKVITIISNEVGYSISEHAAMFGCERLLLGTTKRKLMEKALRGDVIREVSGWLPEEIQLVIYRS
jgi:amino acid transporter